jgi:hypothetical protein
VNRAELMERGQQRVLDFCEQNAWRSPVLKTQLPGRLRGACGLYDRGTLYVEESLCARPGYGGRAWSWPGYLIDRTPYGVWAHELGHYADELLGDVSRGVLADVQDEPLTSYCPNPMEWWAELFRLFVTNPSLLRLVRPRTYIQIRLLGVRPVEERGWKEVLAGCPDRTRRMAQKRIDQAKEQRLGWIPSEGSTAFIGFGYPPAPLACSNLEWPAPTTVSTRRTRTRKESSMASFSEQLRKAILNCGLPICHLASVVGLAPCTITRFIKGETGLSSKTADILTGFLKLELVQVEKPRLPPRRKRGRPRKE